jgi:hypothetical protein
MGLGTESSGAPGNKLFDNLLPPDKLITMCFGLHLLVFNLSAMAYQSNSDLDKVPSNYGFFFSFLSFFFLFPFSPSFPPNVKTFRKSLDRYIEWRAYCC